MPLTREEFDEVLFFLLLELHAVVGVHDERFDLVGALELLFVQLLELDEFLVALCVATRAHLAHFKI